MAATVRTVTDGICAAYGCMMRKRRYTALAQVPRAAKRPTPADVLSVVADVTGVAVDELRGRSRAKRASRARSLAAYLLRADADLTAAQVAPILGRSMETIFYLSRRVSASLGQ